MRIGAKTVARAEGSHGCSDTPHRVSANCENRNVLVTSTKFILQFKFPTVNLVISTAIDAYVRNLTSIY